METNKPLSNAGGFTPTLHKLKTWPKYFWQVKLGMKTFEVRKNDRNFQVGDEVLYEEYIPSNNEYTGEICHRKITYILDGGDFGIEEGYIVYAHSPL